MVETANFLIGTDMVRPASERGAATLAAREATVR